MNVNSWNLPPIHSYIFLSYRATRRGCARIVQKSLIPVVHLTIAAPMSATPTAGASAFSTSPTPSAKDEWSRYRRRTQDSLEKHYNYLTCGEIGGEQCEGDEFAEPLAERKEKTLEANPVKWGSQKTSWKGQLTNFSHCSKNVRTCVYSSHNV